MQYQVPQFVEVEDKIVGPLTLKQTLYIGVPALFSVILYFTVQTWLWLMLSVITVGGGLSLALVKLNGQPLRKVLGGAVDFYWQPQSYVWQPHDPKLPKNEATLAQAVGSGFYVEKVLSGMALRDAWQYVQTGSKSSTNADKTFKRPVAERYQMVQKLTGERRAARRVDYR